MGMKNKSKLMAKIFSREGFYVILFFCLCTVAVTAVYLSASKVKKNIQQVTVSKEGTRSLTSSNQELEAEDKIIAGNNLIPKVVKEKPKYQKTREVSEVKAVKGIHYEKPIKKKNREVNKENKANVKDSSFIYPVSGEIVKPYDEVRLQESKTLQQWETHEGIDISCDMATEVKAAAEGRVIEITNDEKMSDIEKTGLGVTVKIDHGNGVISIYSNLAEEVKVKKGDFVKKGAVIGIVGDTAVRETSSIEGSHLHFAIMKRIDNESKLVDPCKYIKK